MVEILVAMSTARSRNPADGGRPGGAGGLWKVASVQPSISYFNHLLAAAFDLVSFKLDHGSIERPQNKVVGKTVGQTFGRFEYSAPFRIGFTAGGIPKPFEIIYG